MKRISYKHTPVSVAAATMRERFGRDAERQAHLRSNDALRAECARFWEAVEAELRNVCKHCASDQKGQS